jgi:hypothetical protein
MSVVPIRIVVLVFVLMVCGSVYCACSTRPRRHGLTPELSDSRPTVITPATLDNQNASPKPVTLELRSGAAVRSSALVSPFFHSFFV